MIWNQIKGKKLYMVGMEARLRCGKTPEKLYLLAAGSGKEARAYGREIFAIEHSSEANSFFYNRRHDSHGADDLVSFAPTSTDSFESIPRYLGFVGRVLVLSHGRGVSFARIRRDRSLVPDKVIGSAYEALLERLPRSQLNRLEPLDASRVSNKDYSYAYFYFRLSIKPEESLVQGYTMTHMVVVMFRAKGEKEGKWKVMDWVPLCFDGKRMSFPRPLPPRSIGKAFNDLPDPQEPQNSQTCATRPTPKSQASFGRIHDPSRKEQRL